MDEGELVRRLKAGDEAAFNALVTGLQRSLRATAIGIVGVPATADEVVQDAWLAVIENIGGFEERASIKTWIFAILVNKARTRAKRDGRMVPLAQEELSRPNEAAVPEDRFDAKGMWRTPPRSWDEITPERIVDGRQMLDHVRQAIDALPPGQRAALTMVEDAGLGHADAARLLDIEVSHLRVLVHRARASIRRALAEAIGD